MFFLVSDDDAVELWKSRSNQVYGQVLRTPMLDSRTEVKLALVHQVGKGSKLIGGK